LHPHHHTSHSSPTRRSSDLNDQEFWFWVKHADMPQQFYCAYKDLEEGQVRVMPLPIQPSWIMETLGMGPYGPAEKYTLESDANRSEEHTSELQSRFDLVCRL